MVWPDHDRNGQRRRRDDDGVDVSIRRRRVRLSRSASVGPATPSPPDRGRFWRQPVRCDDRYPCRGCLANTVSIGTLVDGTTSNATTTLTITDGGGGSTTIGTITDTALTTLDLSGTSGTVTIGSGTPLAQSLGITLTSSSSGNDTVTLGSGTDVVNISAGTNAVTMGSGTDTLNLTGGTTTLTERCERGHIQLRRKFRDHRTSWRGHGLYAHGHLCRDDDGADGRCSDSEWNRHLRLRRERHHHHPDRGRFWRRPVRCDDCYPCRRRLAYRVDRDPGGRRHVKRHDHLDDHRRRQWFNDHRHDHRHGVDDRRSERNLGDRHNRHGRVERSGCELCDHELGSGADTVSFHQAAPSQANADLIASGYNRATGHTTLQFGTTTLAATADATATISAGGFDTSDSSVDAFLSHMAGDTAVVAVIAAYNDGINTWVASAAGGAGGLTNVVELVGVNTLTWSVRLRPRPCTSRNWLQSPAPSKEGERCARETFQEAPRATNLRGLFLNCNALPERCGAQRLTVEQPHDPSKRDPTAAFRDAIGVG